ncbi:MAG: hypothetical protein ABH811_00350 [archaeon]
MFNKKAQVGETITWFVATIIIIVILAIAIFIVSSRIFENDKVLKVEKIDSDLLVTKSLLGYLLTDKNYDGFKEIELSEGVIDFDNAFFDSVFNLYKKEYSSNQVLFRINSEYEKWEGYSKSAGLPNKILLNRGGLPSNMRATKFFYESINLKNIGDKKKNTIIELMLN